MLSAAISRAQRLSHGFAQTVLGLYGQLRVSYSSAVPVTKGCHEITEADSLTRGMSTALTDAQARALLASATALPETVRTTGTAASTSLHGWTLCWTPRTDERKRGDFTFTDPSGKRLFSLPALQREIRSSAVGAGGEASGGAQMSTLRQLQHSSAVSGGEANGTVGGAQASHLGIEPRRSQRSPALSYQMLTESALQVSRSPLDEGARVIGRRCSILWAGCSPPTWFKGTVRDFSSPRHLVVYDDGELKWHDLAAEAAVGQLEWAAPWWAAPWPTAASRTDAHAHGAKEPSRSAADASMQIAETEDASMQSAETADASMQRAETADASMARAETADASMQSAGEEAGGATRPAQPPRPALETPQEGADGSRPQMQGAATAVGADARHALRSPEGADEVAAAGYACGTCGLRFSTGRALGGHVRHAHRNVVKPSDASPQALDGKAAAEAACDRDNAYASELDAAATSTATHAEHATASFLGAAEARAAAAAEELELVPSGNPSGFKSVYKNRGKYDAQVNEDGLKRHLGSFATPEEAALHYARHVGAARAAAKAAEARHELPQSSSASTASAPPPGWVCPALGETIQVEVEVEDALSGAESSSQADGGAARVWAPALVTEHPAAGVFGALIVLPDGTDEWSDLFHWDEERVDWRRCDKDAARPSFPRAPEGGYVCRQCLRSGFRSVHALVEHATSECGQRRTRDAVPAGAEAELVHADSEAAAAAAEETVEVDTVEAAMETMLATVVRLERQRLAAAAVHLATKEGLVLVPRIGTLSGFLNVARCYETRAGDEQFRATVRRKRSVVGGSSTRVLGVFDTAEEAALCVARHLGAVKCQELAARVEPAHRDRYEPCTERGVEHSFMTVSAGLHVASDGAVRLQLHLRTSQDGSHEAVLAAVEAMVEQVERQHAAAAAVQLAEEEGLVLVPCFGTATGFLNVESRGGRLYKALLRRQGKVSLLGTFETPEEAALCVARSVGVAKCHELYERETQRLVSKHVRVPVSATLSVDKASSVRLHLKLRRPGGSRKRNPQREQRLIDGRNRADRDRATALGKREQHALCDGADVSHQSTGTASGQRPSGRPRLAPERLDPGMPSLIEAQRKADREAKTASHYYEIERICEERVREITPARASHGKSQASVYVTEFRVRWRGYGREDDTWEKQRNLASGGAKVRAQRRTLAPWWWMVPVRHASPPARLTHTPRPLGLACLPTARCQVSRGAGCRCCRRCRLGSRVCRADGPSRTATPCLLERGSGAAGAASSRKRRRSGARSAPSCKHIPAAVVSAQRAIKRTVLGSSTVRREWTRRTGRVAARTPEHACTRRTEHVPAAVSARTPELLFSEPFGSIV